MTPKFLTQNDTQVPHPEWHPSSSPRMTQKFLSQNDTEVPLPEWHRSSSPRMTRKFLSQNDTEVPLPEWHGSSSPRMTQKFLSQNDTQVPPPLLSPPSSPLSYTYWWHAVSVFALSSWWPCGLGVHSRTEDPGFDSHLWPDFFRVESYQWLTTWHSSGARCLVL